MPSMVALEEAGAVTRDGTISTGKRGKPPIAWVLVAEADLESALAAVEEKAAQPSTRGPKVSTEAVQSRLERVLAEIKASPLAGDCHCVVEMETTTPEELRYHPGCKTHWICGALTSLRVKSGLVRNG